MVLAVVLGARRGELCSLRWSDVDFNQGDVLVAGTVIHVPGEPLIDRDVTKTRTKRRVAVGIGTLELLPARELGCGSGVTCWRRLRDWQQAGVWEQLHHRLLDWLGDDGQVDWSRAAIDSVSVRARRGGTSLAQTRSTAASQDPSTTC